MAAISSSRVNLMVGSLISGGTHQGQSEPS